MDYQISSCRFAAVLVAALLQVQWLPPQKYHSCPGKDLSPMPSCKFPPRFLPGTDFSNTIHKNPSLLFFLFFVFLLLLFFSLFFLGTLTLFPCFLFSFFFFIFEKGK